MKSSAKHLSQNLFWEKVWEEVWEVVTKTFFIQKKIGYLKTVSFVVSIFQTLFGKTIFKKYHLYLLF